MFEQTQEIAAKDAPIIPFWQGDEVAVSRNDVQRGRRDARPRVHLPVLADLEVVGHRTRLEGRRARAPLQRWQILEAAWRPAREPRSSRYLLTRLALVVPMVLILLTFVFLLMRVAPGDPISAALGGHVPQSVLDAAQARGSASTSRSSQQYVEYLGNVVTRELRDDDHRQPPGQRHHPRERRARRSSSPSSR